ncbi:MAG: phospholipid-binding protein MlaC [Thermaurantiacus tibetensis]|uniref:MlaC/ttg2D family ABC transporter substrate-binding protein n=1 Tax=Thermaurantiacus tibetensis TaxID=2759035 RepID=UPI0018907CF7|nr:ABC transporter substrate-binding protein [Thermaurantiacus tibetensis]
MLHAAARALALAALVGAGPAPPAAAAPATAEQQAEAARFIEKLANDAFAVLRDRSLTRDQAKARFKAMLRENFAIEQTGMRIIRKHRAGLTPAQLEAYRAALPDFIVNTYADRLFDFANARLTVVRQVPRGSRGDVDVYARVTDPAGGRPFETIWATSNASGRWLVTNLTVNGVNIALTQEADFDAYIQRNGFDALVDFMRKAK